ncbi:hypothetical protein [Ralstonia insidiosa]|uniref:hypothetical protein n=1 Tax=Ralstonia insidiosa TaxID=190721 RepID=UPI000CEE37E2|nr:hypothetical protein [Ralstonia insidiosa]
METRSFAPLYTKTSQSANGALVASVTIAATTTASSANLPGNPQSNGNQIRIANTSAAWAYVNFGQLYPNLNAATVATGYPVGPGAVAIVSVDTEVGAASVILSAGTGNVVFTRGEGLGN